MKSFVLWAIDAAANHRFRCQHRCRFHFLHPPDLFVREAVLYFWNHSVVAAVVIVAVAANVWVIVLLRLPTV